MTAPAPPNSFRAALGPLPQGHPGHWAGFAAYGEISNNSMSNTSVALPGMVGGTPAAPYAKFGGITSLRSEVVLVNAPSGDYVFCVITKDQADERWEPDNEGYVLLRNVSAVLWKHFEPDYPWVPPPNAARYVP